MTSTSVDISLIILFKEKNNNFQHALDSAQFAQEIITVENKEILDFSQVRNQAQKMANHRWVFFLDSDEIISPDSIEEIKNIVSENKADGIVVNRQDIFYNQALNHGEAGQTKLIRMGQKNSMCWERPVHETVKIRGKIEESNIKILHYSHPSITEFISSIINYAEIEAKFRIKNNHPIRNIELITFPKAKFIQNYIFKKGFLDGWRGLIYAIVMTLHSLAVRVFQYELKGETKL